MWNFRRKPNKNLARHQTAALSIAPEKKYIYFTISPPSLSIIYSTSVFARVCYNCTNTLMTPSLLQNFPGCCFFITDVSITIFAKTLPHYYFIDKCFNDTVSITNKYTWHVCTMYKVAKNFQALSGYAKIVRLSLSPCACAPIFSLTYTL
jgi:hypothetical protein